MYGHERSLVQRLAGKPFALVGVNTDSDLMQIRQIVRAKEITWRSFYDGVSQRITGQYGIQAFPTILLIDHEGRVQFKFNSVEGSTLDAAIDYLLSQVTP